MPEVLILTGPPAAGKSTVARALAERYDRVAHVEVDLLRHFVTPTGYVHPWGPPAAWRRQQGLATRNAACVAANFVAERFAVILDDVIVTRTELDAYLEALAPAAAAVHCVRLLPRLDVCLARNRARSEGRMPEHRIETVHAEMSTVADLPGVTLDSSEMDAHQTADRLQSLTTSGASLVRRP